MEASPRLHAKVRARCYVSMHGTLNNNSVSIVCPSKAEPQTGGKQAVVIHHPSSALDQRLTDLTAVRPSSDLSETHAALSSEPGAQPQPHSPRQSAWFNLILEEGGKRDEWISNPAAEVSDLSDLFIYQLILIFDWSSPNPA